MTSVKGSELSFTSECISPDLVAHARQNSITKLWVFAPLQKAVQILDGKVLSITQPPL